jgi:hypothetical protein
VIDAVLEVGMARHSRKSRLAGTSSVSIVALAPVVTPVAMDVDQEFPVTKAACADGGSSCFVAGTSVLMADGSEKCIDDVVAGDCVLGQGGAVNTVTGVACPKLGKRELYSINGGRHFVTAEHPFKTMAGWKSIDPAATEAENAALEVKRLEVGDALIVTRVRSGVRAAAAGDPAVDPAAQPAPGCVAITRLRAASADPDTRLYNLLLDGNHTYHADGYLVHNKGGGGGGSGGSSPGSSGSAGSGNSGHGSAGSGHGTNGGPSSGSSRASAADSVGR